jgi:hypothetical protein
MCITPPSLLLFLATLLTVHAASLNANSALIARSIPLEDRNLALRALEEDCEDENDDMKKRAVAAAAAAAADDYEEDEEEEYKMRAVDDDDDEEEDEDDDNNE